MKLTITGKFVGALIGTLVVSCATIVYTCLHYMSMPVEEELSANIRRIQTIVDTTNQTTTAGFVKFAALLAEQSGFPEAVAARDAAKVRSLSQQAMREAGSDFMTVTDAQGKVIARGHSAKINDDVTNQQTVVMALKGKPSACVVSGTEVPFTIRASNPILLDGKLVGTLSIGTSLVSPNYVDWLKKMGDLEVTVFKNDTRVMTTIMGQDGKRAIGTQMQTQEVLDKVLSRGQTFFTRNNILGVHYQSVYWPIRDLNDKIVGMWFVGAPISKLLLLEDKAIRTTLLVSGGVLLLMVLLAVPLGIRLARPIKKISAYAQAVGAGRDDTPLDVYGRDDMGILADLLRSMVAKLQEQSLWFKNILDSIPYGISVTDMDMRWTFINKKALSTMGKKDMAEVLGQHCSAKGGALCGTEDCGIKALRRGQTEVINKQPNGKILQMRLGYLTDRTGNNVGHVEMGIDITEQERLKQEAVLAAAKARRETAFQLEAVVDRLAHASETLSQRINVADHSTEEVARRMASTAEAMDAINASVAGVARNAADAARSSGEVQRKAADGEKIVNTAVADIQNVQRLSQGLKTDMESLNKHASGIGAILNMIRDIADQTNLLALNAAIEAARAGEAGRGFAVVADEVRKLAEKSMNATKDVEEAMAAIQRGASQSADTVDSAVEAIRTATTLAQESGAALRNIVQLSGSASDKVQIIATAAEEQAASTKNINASVENANQMTGTVSSAMRDAMQAIHELSEQAQILHTILDEMTKE